MLEQPDLATDPRFATNSERVANRHTLDAAIAAVAGGLTAATLIARLDSAQIAWARMNSMADFVAHPQLEARGRWRQVDSPGGPIRALAPPVAIDDEPPRMGAVPAVGAHTESILQELGLSASAIAALRAEGAI